jgi:type I restriction enzyme, R subunit
VFSSNGDGFVFHDRTGASKPPADQWVRYRAWKGLDAEAEQVVLRDYYDDAARRRRATIISTPSMLRSRRIAKGCNRVLAGDGDRYLQDLHRIPDHLAAVEVGRAKCILYLADRNVLIDQTMVNDRPFGGTMAKLSIGSKTIEGDDGISIDLGRKAREIVEMSE